jgi:hypothetical protein
MNSRVLYLLKVLITDTSMCLTKDLILQDKGNKSETPVTPVVQNITI